MKPRQDVYEYIQRIIGAGAGQGRRQGEKEAGGWHARPSVIVLCRGPAWTMGVFDNLTSAFFTASSRFRNCGFAAFRSRTRWAAKPDDWVSIQCKSRDLQLDKVGWADVLRNGYCIHPHHPWER